VCVCVCVCVCVHTSTSVCKRVNVWVIFFFAFNVLEIQNYFVPNDGNISLTI